MAALAPPPSSPLLLALLEVDVLGACRLAHPHLGHLHHRLALVALALVLAAVLRAGKVEGGRRVVD